MRDGRRILDADAHVVEPGDVFGDALRVAEHLPGLDYVRVGVEDPLPVTHRDHARRAARPPSSGKTVPLM